jgi:hypothetical protein
MFGSDRAGIVASVNVADMTEEALVARARNAVSVESWVVGECAAQWTKRFARGRSDGDFGILLGLSREQVCARRLVFEKFDGHPTRISLSWSHFYAALGWEDADEVLNWAAESEATIAEMRAWRRAQRGEDLFANNDLPPDLSGESERQPLLPPAVPPTRSEAANNSKADAGEPASKTEATSSESMATVNSGLEHYTPFRGEAGEKPARKKREKKKPQAQPPAEDPEHISDAFEKTLKNYREETQYATVRKLLKRFLKQVDSFEELLPAVGQAPEDVVDVVSGVVHWATEQIRMCKWTQEDRVLAKGISTLLNHAALAAAEVASADREQMALFDAGPPERGRVALPDLLKIWNEAFETASVPTDKRRAALRSRLREPYFVENWRAAIDKARSSPWCCGHNKTGWVANIDWFLRPDTVVRLMEGNHDGFEQDISEAQHREDQNAAAIAKALGG